MRVDDGRAMIEVAKASSRPDTGDGDGSVSGLFRLFRRGGLGLDLLLQEVDSQFRKRVRQGIIHGLSFTWIPVVDPCHLG